MDKRYLDKLNQEKFRVEKNTNPYKKIIKKGDELDTEKFVNIFGSPQQKRNYKKTKKLVQNTKESIMKKALQYCKIDNSTSGKYIITEVLNYSIGSKIVKFIYNEKTENNLFNLILLKVVTYSILTNINENNGLSFRLKKYAEQFTLINYNYQKFKYIDENIKQIILEDQGISEISLHNFYSSVDESINGCLLNILNVLEEIKAITVTKNLMILIKKDEDNKYYKVRATEEEEGIITKAIDDYMAHNKVNYSDLFYKTKIKDKFDRYMKSTLDSIGVISWYRTYEVFIINSTLMNYILDYTDFDERDLPIYYIALNYLFADKMLKNAKNKKEKRLLQKIKSSGNVEQYLKENHIDIENLTRNNFRDFIPSEYIEREKKEMLKITEEKNSKKDFTKLSQTYIEDEETEKISDLILRVEVNERGRIEPLIPLFNLGIDNSKEYERIDISEELLLNGGNRKEND